MRDSSDSSSSKKSTGEHPTSSNDSSEARAHLKTNSRSKPATAHASKQAQGTKAARGTQGGTRVQQRKGTDSSFVDALAQSQADAAANAEPTAAAGEIAGTGGKAKDTNDDLSGNAVAAAPLAFIPQSVAAAMAAAAQAPAQTQPNTAGSTDSAEDDSLAALTANGKPAALAAAALSRAVQDLDAATDPASGPKGNATASTTPAATPTTPDGSDAAAVAFQAHMSISSHFQQPPAVANNSKLEAPIGTAAFNDELGGKITWLANQGVQSANLQLSPEHLGPVNVHICVQDGSASVSFNAAHPDTRAALEQALPRLREMFSTQGLTLADANVSHQSPRDQPQRQPIGSINAAGGVSENSTATSITAIASSRPGLVDTYA
jgi:flagellar hook-length control protein FliK